MVKNSTVIERGRICIRERTSLMNVLENERRYKVGIIVREAGKYSGRPQVGVWYGVDGHGVSKSSVDRMRQIYFNSKSSGRRVEFDQW